MLQDELVLVWISNRHDFIFYLTIYSAKAIKLFHKALKQLPTIKIPNKTDYKADNPRQENKKCKRYSLRINSDDKSEDVKVVAPTLG